MGIFFKKNWWIILLVAVTVVAIGITAWALFFREIDQPIPPDYAPKEAEQNATPIQGDEGGEKLQSPEGGGAVSISYTKEIGIDLSDKTAELYFANPSQSTQNMVIQLIIHDSVILSSGLIKSGNEVRTMTLADGAEKKLALGGYDGKLLILYYDQESGEKAMLNTEIPVTVTVTE